MAHHSDAGRFGELLSRSPGFLAPCRVDLSNFFFCSPIPCVTVWPQRCALQTLYFQLPVLTQPCLNLTHDWCNSCFICCRLTYICSTVPHSFVVWIHHKFYDLILPIRAWHTHFLREFSCRQLLMRQPIWFLPIHKRHLHIFLHWCPFRTRIASPFLLPNVVNKQFIWHTW